MKHALIYARFSPRPNADECTSNEKQVERCMTYCARTALEVCGTYSDVAVSGKVLDRPELSLAIERLKPGMVLVVDACDRLARDMLVNLTIRHQVERAGATIEFANGSPSATTPEGELFQNIMGAFAQYERSRISRATSAGLKRKQAAGEHLGKAPVGYKVVDKRLVEDEGEQNAIASIMRKVRVSADLGRKITSVDITRLMNNNGSLFRGKPWSARTVRKIIRENKNNSM